ncbi:MAG: ABC transporter ATP-binding protein [Actinobacteria bacterium]|nr:ABC transporter ATP-binding protein [Actinomycetota bacterium]MBU1942604.1 ABC transporter ATP-binding protein [Actinomycetota bacterium]MBU2688720.1 ABC transporter ATP-binding protein [Actinomycetota bacterium]
MSSITLEDLHKVYGEGGGEEVRAVDGIDLSVDRGEFVAIIGPSGSGKSTLLNLIGGLDVPTSGRVEVDGMDTGGLSDRELTRLRREKIGFVFQEFNLLPVLNALENVQLPLRYLKVNPKERRERAMEALEKVDLVNRAGNRPSQLSGGERQRVAIARALVTTPALVLADEPTGELDTANTCRIIEYMRVLNRELEQTFAIVTHDPMVARYAGRVITLRDGRVASDEPGEDAPLTCDDLKPV